MEPKVNNEFLSILEELSINGEPRSSLEECLACYDKEMLEEIAARYGMDDKSMDVQEQAHLLAPMILGDLERAIAQEKLENIRRLLEVQGSTYSVDDINCIQVVSEFLRPRFIGWIFYFVEAGLLHITLPTELRQGMERLLADDKKVNDIKRKQKMRQMVLALVNLYGICEKEQFCKVWAHHSKETIPAAELEEFFQETAVDTEIFEVKEDSLVIKGMPDGETYELLKEHMKTGDYYMPTAEELKVYEDDTVDTSSKEYLALERYVKSKIPSEELADYMLFELSMCCVSDAFAEDVVSLANAFDVEFEHPGDVNEFCRLYCELQNNSPSWMLQGYTPAAAGKPVTFHTAVIPPETKLKSRRIGRNDLCPCGSGKKYKKCCGK